MIRKPGKAALQLLVEPSDVVKIRTLNAPTGGRTKTVSPTQTGDGPPFVKWGSRVLYRRCDVDRWLAERVRRSTTEPRPAASGGQA